MKEIKRVPQLRFPEFNGEWREMKYNNIYSFYSTNSFSRDKLNYEGGAVKNIHYGDIHTKFSTLFNIEKEIVPFVNEDVNISKIKEENYLREGDLLIADASEDYNDIGKTVEVVNLNNEKVISGLHTFHARPDKLDMALGFSGYMLQNNNVRLQVKKIAQGTKVLGLATSRLGNINLNIPLIEEQQKIATFLSSVDKKIDQLQQKKSLLEQYKKGVMQQLFSQQLRFKDDNGNDYPDWEIKKLGEMAKFMRGSSLSKSDLVEDGTNKCIHYGELFTLYNEVITKVFSLTNKDGVRSIKGDILMPSSDVTPDGLAQASSIQLEDVVLGGDINIIRLRKNISSVFISYLLNFSKNAIIRVVTGTTVKHIYNKDLKELIFKVPESIEEQTKIANFLSAIDTKIESVNTQIETTQQFKKGLLQQMFV